MKHFSYLLFGTLFFLKSAALTAQAPPNLTSNVDLTSCSGCTDFAPGGFFSSTGQIINAFNFARRAEESQLGLPANSLGTLSLPASYASLSDDQRFFYIINEERLVRAGKSYTVPSAITPIGKPFESVENTLDGVAQNFAQWLFDNNLFQHTGPGGNTPDQRINAAFTSGCVEFMARSENIYRACGGSASYVVEQALFSWLYRDAASLWGHREAAFIQNLDPSGNPGINDNRGASGNEGFIGLGVVSGSGYTPCGALPARLVVFNLMDPSAGASCSFSNQANPLPVRLISFKAQTENKLVNLTWTTAEESNSGHFEILHGTDPRKPFEPIGHVNANGNSTEQIQYRFTHLKPSLGVNYYQLVQIDLDGSRQTSGMVSAFFSSEPVTSQQIKVFPNPLAAGETLLIEGADLSSFNIEVFDFTGRTYSFEKLQEQDSERLQIILPGKLPAGVFLIRFSGKQQTIVKQVIIR